MDMMNVLALSFVGLPVLGIVVSNLLRGERRRVNRKYVDGAVAGLYAVCAAAEFFLLNARGLNSCNLNLFSSLPGGPGAEYFALTRFGLVVMFCMGVVALSSVLIATRTIRIKTNSYSNLLMILLLGMTGLIIATDLFTLYAFMEITGIASFIMIGMFKEDESLEGAFKYLVMSSVAGVLILSGIAILFMFTGTLRFANLTPIDVSLVTGTGRVVLSVSIVLMLSGFCVKAGAAPFHNWLPDAHQSADTAISVLLSGIVIKVAGIYGIMTLAKLFRALHEIHLALAAIGLISIFIGALLALRQTHFKRIVAYSSVSQMGYILLGLSAGTTLGFVAAAAHIFSHAMFKSTLFANAAALHERADTLNIGELGGLESKMPVTSFSSVIAFFSTAGIPPFAGFWSKLLIILSLWLSGREVLAAVALFAGIFTGAYFLRLQRRVFFGKPVKRFENLREIDGGILAAEILLTAFTVAGGLLFPLIMKYLSSIGILG